MDLITLAMLFSDVCLSTVVFILIARPDVGVAFILRRTGLRDSWFEEHVSAEELARLRTSIRFLGYFGLCLVFGWSFVVGATMTLGRIALP